MTRLVGAIEGRPLNAKQKAFALGLGVAWASCDTDFLKPYVDAGYKEDRGNACRLASDPRVIAVAESVCGEQLRLHGVHIGYLQAKAMKLLEASTTHMQREIARLIERDPLTGEPSLRSDLTPEELAEIDAATWPLSKLKIGDIAVELPDKKGITEMLAKQLGVGKDDGTNVNVLTAIQVITGVPRAPDEAANVDVL